MIQLWHRNKKLRKKEMIAEIIQSAEIERLKQEVHESADHADRNIKKLNKLLRANGITLKIHIASGRHD